LELLKEIFELEQSKNFIALCESIAKQNPNYVRNGIGINFSETGIESVKIYYGFTHKLQKSDVEKFHIYGNSNSFYKMESLLKPEDYQWNDDLATGVSLALKIDKNFKSTIGYFMIYELPSTDNIFTSSPLKEYYLTHKESPFLNRKGVFTLIDNKGKEHTKDYYYVNHPKLKEIINREFNVNIQLAPIVEWILGKGFYEQSTILDQKIVLLGNYERIYNDITNTLPVRETETDVHQWMIKHFKSYPVPPGFYKNKNIRSFYYYDSFHPHPTVIDIVPKVQKKLQFNL
jgi:hypothetical protein